MKTCSICQATYADTAAFCLKDGSPLVLVDELAPGFVLRRKYRVDSEIGRGAMGVVYRVTHLHLKEVRALKVINPRYADDPRFVERFFVEALIARRLQHPNIVRIDDVEETDEGRPFVVMEYVAGSSLGTVIKDEGYLDPVRAFSIAEQVCAALAVAHAGGVVHRDIKPDNILIADIGGIETVKVVDFGLAKARTEINESVAVASTETGLFVGTPKYASPEQAMLQKGAELDGRTDLYSLGLVLYEMLTGRSPFTAATANEMLQEQVGTPAPPLHFANPQIDLPSGAEGIVKRALEKDRDKRYQTAEEMRSAFIGVTETLAARTRAERIDAESTVTPDSMPAGLNTPPHPKPDIAGQVPDVKQSRRRRSRYPTLLLLASSFAFAALAGLFLYYYSYYSRILDLRLQGEVFDRTAQIYAAPSRVFTGQTLSLDAVAVRLQRAGLRPLDTRADDGSYEIRNSSITIRPTAGKTVRLEFSGNRLVSIKTDGKAESKEAWLPGELVTSLANNAGQKRRLSKFDELPQTLVAALIASEDPGFYRSWYSHLTRNVARELFLPSGNTTLGEIFVTTLLEHRLSKTQILELYANDIYLGRRGSWTIHGVGEAAVVYFGKSVGELTLPEAATIVAIIPDPDDTLSPLDHPDAVKQKRDEVLAAMTLAGSLNDREYEAARSSPLKIRSAQPEDNVGPFLSWVQDALLKDFPGEALKNGGLRVETSLDSNLQKIAEDAVHNNLRSLQQGISGALLVLDAHTGEVKAMAVGGDEDFGDNFFVAEERQPGSAFKPFVYAAALEISSDTATQGRVASAKAITPLTTIMDGAATFSYNSEILQPSNYGQPFRGLVTVRMALEQSLDVPAIKMAERIGYDRVTDFARRLGFQTKTKGPSIAIGAFEATPIELAAAYTILAGEGRRTSPHMLLRVTDSEAVLVKIYKYSTQQVITPQLAYVVTHLLEGVVNSGVGSRVRAQGFSLPAAGMTGTSRDGWFVGYTKDLLAIAWVGYGDKRDVVLTGQTSALLIWADFMKKASPVGPPADSQVMAFPVPEGVVLSDSPCGGSLAAWFGPIHPTKESCAQHK